MKKLLMKMIAVLKGSNKVQRDEFGNRIHFQSKEAKAYFEAFKKEQGWK